MSEWVAMLLGDWLHLSVQHCTLICSALTPLAKTNSVIQLHQNVFQIPSSASGCFSVVACCLTSTPA